MKSKSEYGRQLLHHSWIAYEFTTLQTLYGAGADVPEPYTMAHNAVLMSFIGDGEMSASTLNKADLDHSEAGSLFDRTLRNIDILLSHECNHGNLSAYNVLYWGGNLTLIDFPQVVSPKTNRKAYKIFERDVRRICEYFARQGIESHARKLTEEVWASHGYRIRNDI